MTSLDVEADFDLFQSLSDNMIKQYGVRGAVTVATLDDDVGIDVVTSGVVLMTSNRLRGFN